MGDITPLPALAQEKLRSVEIASLSGLFAEVHRAWISFDDELLVWNYDDPTQADYQ